MTIKILCKKQNTIFPGDNFRFKVGITLTQLTLDQCTPYQFFKYFFIDEVINKIVAETNFYSTESRSKQNKPIDCSIYDI